MANELMNLFSAKVGEKAAEGAFDCLKNWIGGKNAVELERAKMQHDAVNNAFIFAGIALVGIILDKLMDKTDDANFEINKNGVKVNWRKTPYKQLSDKNSSEEM